jgi:serine/threonine protein kinase
MEEIFSSNRITIRSLLKKKKCLSKNDALNFFIDVLMGMMELVKKGIIHRDLKPANILINKGAYKIAGINCINFKISGSQEP